MKQIWMQNHFINCRKSVFSYVNISVSNVMSYEYMRQNRNSDLSKSLQPAHVMWVRNDKKLVEKTSTLPPLQSPPPVHTVLCVLCFAANYCGNGCTQKYIFPLIGSKPNLFLTNPISTAKPRISIFWIRNVENWLGWADLKIP